MASWPTAQTWEPRARYLPFLSPGPGLPGTLSRRHTEGCTHRAGRKFSAEAVLTPAGAAWPCARASPSNPASPRATDKGQTWWARQSLLGDSPEAPTGHTGQEHPFLKAGPKQELPTLFSRVLLALGASDRLLRLRGARGHQHPVRPAPVLERSPR